MLFLIKAWYSSYMDWSHTICLIASLYVEGFWRIDVSWSLWLYAFGLREPILDLIHMAYMLEL